MNALELKNRIKTWDNNKTLLKISGISILITMVFFPINLWLNPNVDPIVYEYPFLLGFGFVAFVLVIMMLIVFGGIFTIMMLDSYLFFSPKILDSTGKVVSNIISRDDELLDRWTDGILSRTAKINKKYDDPKFEEIQQGSLRQQTEIDELKQENKELRKDNKMFKEDYTRAFKIQNQKYEQSERRRIHAESEAVKERVLKENTEQKLKEKDTNELKILERLDSVSAELLDVKEELKRLRDNRDR